MKNILEHIEELDAKDWDYYRKRGSLLDSSIMKDSDSKHHTQFVFSYFSDGEKYKIVDMFLNHEDEFDRAKHANSIFFLGCLLYKKLKLRDKIDFYIRDHDQFNLIWFLTSLAHDFAYKYEDEDDFFVGSPRSKFFDILFNANKNLVEDALEKHIERHVAMEMILEKLASEKGLNIEAEISTIRVEKQDEIHNAKIDFFISTVGDILTQSE